MRSIVTAKGWEIGWWDARELAVYRLAAQSARKQKISAATLIPFASISFM